MPKLTLRICRPRYRARNYHWMVAKLVKGPNGYVEPGTKAICGADGGQHGFAAMTLPETTTKSGIEAMGYKPCKHCERKLAVLEKEGGFNVWLPKAGAADDNGSGGKPGHRPDADQPGGGRDQRAEEQDPQPRV